MERKLNLRNGIRKFRKERRLVEGVTMAVGVGLVGVDSDGFVMSTFGKRLNKQVWPLWVLFLR